MYLELVVLVYGWLVQRPVAEEGVDVVAGIVSLHLLGRARGPSAAAWDWLYVADLDVWTE